MRLWLSVLGLPLGVLGSLLPLPVRAEEPRVQLLVQSSPLAGYRYGEGAEVWPLLREGDPLELVPEPGNASPIRLIHLIH